jgi:hypothetical protein
MLLGCKQAPESPDSKAKNQFVLIVKYRTDGSKEVTDGKGKRLEPIKLENPSDVLGSLAKRLKQDVLRVEHLNNPVVFTFRESPECSCECDGGYCQCSPYGCVP